MPKTTWTIDPAHSLLEFSVKHMMISTVKGRFTDFQGTIVADLPNLTGAEIAVSAVAASIDTRDSQRDDHLRSADFFDVAKFPAVRFEATRILSYGKDEYNLIGNLTMHGVTQEVAFDAAFEGMGKDPWGNERAGFSATARVNRKDFGLVWNALLETGGILVGDEVRIEIQFEAIKATA